MFLRTDSDGGHAGILARLKTDAEIVVPLFQHGLCVGFPSPTDDFLDEAIDLTQLLVRNPPATFLWKVDGHSMRDAGIYDKDLLIVDRSLAPRHGDVVVATVHGERSLKRLHLDGSRPRLSFENRDMPAFELPEIAEIEVWGVALGNVHWRRDAEPVDRHPDMRTLDLVKAAKRGARAIWRDGYRYAKAGIVMTDLVPAGTAQRLLFDARNRERSDRLMAAIDAVNGRFEQGMIAPAAVGIRQKWATKFEMRTPRYTTRIKEIPRVMAGPSEDSIHGQSSP